MITGDNSSILLLILEFSLKTSTELIPEIRCQRRLISSSSASTSDICEGMNSRRASHPCGSRNEVRCDTIEPRVSRLCASHDSCLSLPHSSSRHLLPPASLVPQKAPTSPPPSSIQRIRPRTTSGNTIHSRGMRPTR